MSITHRILSAFALILLTVSQAQAQERRFDISQMGAVGDGATTNTATIQAVIDRTARIGGGTVVVPEGTFLTGALFFKPGVNLHLNEGGVLKGTTSMMDYKLVQTRWEGEERIWVSALINVFGGDGFHLSGTGTLDGSGDVWHRPGPQGQRGSGDFNPNAPQDEILPLGPAGGLEAAEDSPAYELTALALPAYAKPRLVAIQNSSGVVVEDVHLLNQSSWGLFLLYSNDVEIRNVNIRAERYIPSSDGIDIDSSSDVLISNVDIDVNDDCIAIKSGKDEDGRRVGRPAENIVVENSVFRYGHGGVSMGSEMSGGIRNVEIRDTVIMEGNWAPIRFKSQPSRGGIVENITYRNIELQNTLKAFEFNMAWRMVDPKPPSDPLPIVRNVNIINVFGTVENVGDMTGLEDSPISNVRFENTDIKASGAGLILRDVVDLDLDGLTIEPPEGVEPIVHQGE